MNIINLSLLLANAAILASASDTGPGPTPAPSKASKFSLNSLTNYLSNLNSNSSASSSPQTGTFSNEADKIFKNVKNKVGAFSDMVSTSAENTLNSLSSKAVKENEPVKLDRIMACKATGSKDDFIKAIKAYANFDNKGSSATSGDASIIDLNDANSRKKDSGHVDTGTPNENASSTKDTELKPYYLALKKLIVLFNCPKSNALLAELTENEMKLGQNQIPDIVKVALKQKLLEFPFGSLQVDYDRTLEKCVESINTADHDNICPKAPCTEADLEVKSLEENLVKLDYCSHHFIQDSIKKIAVEVHKNEQVKKLGNQDKTKTKTEFTLRRPDLLEIISKIANTLPRIQMGTGNFLNQNLLEKTNLKCRANLQKLLGISEPDVPSYDYLFTEVKTDSAGADGAGDGVGDGAGDGAVNVDALKNPATNGGTPSVTVTGATGTGVDARANASANPGDTSTPS